MAYSRTAAFQTSTSAEMLYKRDHPDGPWWDVLPAWRRDTYRAMSALDALDRTRQS